MLQTHTVLGSMFLRRGDVAVRVPAPDLLALRRSLHVGMELTDGDSSITLETASDVETLTNAINEQIRLARLTRQARRRALWN